MDCSIMKAHHRMNENNLLSPQPMISMLDSVGDGGGGSGGCVSTGGHSICGDQSTLPLLKKSLSTTTSSAANAAAAAATAAMLVALCGACCRPICDRYIMRVVDISYHERCLQCSTCSIRLIHSCFQRDGKLYCRIDYERLFTRNRCVACTDKINSDEFVMRVSGNIFHLKCFVCVVCGGRLQKGQEFVVKQCQLFCRPDYEKEVEMLQGLNCAADEMYCEGVFPQPVDGRRGPKRPRTILTTQQRRAFKACFDISPRPCRKVRENLAKDTGLSLRIVQVWFQNQRAKVKKIEKKILQDSNKNRKEPADTQDDASETEHKIMSAMKIKDENQSDSESFGSAPSLNNDMALGSIMKSHQSQQGSNSPNFDSFEDDHHKCGGGGVGNAAPLDAIMDFGYSTLQHLVAPLVSPLILNPIDRLYSMQNSYFRCTVTDDGGGGGQPKQLQHDS